MTSRLSTRPRKWLPRTSPVRLVVLSQEQHGKTLSVNSTAAQETLRFPQRSLTRGSANQAYNLASITLQCYHPRLQAPGHRPRTIQKVRAKKSRGSKVCSPLAGPASSVLTDWGSQAPRRRAARLEAQVPAAPVHTRLHQTRQVAVGELLHPLCWKLGK